MRTESHGPLRADARRRHGALGARSGLGPKPALRTPRSGTVALRPLVFLFVLSAWGGTGVNAQGTSGFEMKAPSKAGLGLPIEIEGTARYPQGFTLSLDTSTQDAAPFFIQGVSLGPPRTSGGLMVQEVRLKVVPFDTGTLAFPSLAWTLTTADGSADSLKSPPVKVEAAGPALPPGGGDVRDIKPPLGPAWWPLIAAALLLAVLAAWVVRGLRRRRSEAAAAPADGRAPHEIALDELEKLRGSLLPDKDYYVRLTDILRAYLELRFGIPAMNLTTTDLGRQMRQAEIDRAAASACRAVLERGDLVKFAKHSPSSAERSDDLETAAGAVRATAPAPVPELVQTGR